MSDEKNLSLKDLQAILAEQSKQNAEQLKTIVAELKKPTILEQAQLDKEQKAILLKNESRKNNAQSQLTIVANKKAIQRICTHKHRDGNSHCVFVMEQSGPGYILCQKNQCIIRPGNVPQKYNGQDIYDTDLFNRLFQELPSNELFQ